MMTVATVGLIGWRVSKEVGVFGWTELCNIVKVWIHVILSCLQTHLTFFCYHFWVILWPHLFFWLNQNRHVLWRIRSIWIFLETFFLLCRFCFWHIMTLKHQVLLHLQKFLNGSWLIDSQHLLLSWKKLYLCRCCVLMMLCRWCEYSIEFS
jgi:hypothetical protein